MNLLCLIFASVNLILVLVGFSKLQVKWQILTWSLMVIGSAGHIMFDEPVALYFVLAQLAGIVSATIMFFFLFVWKYKEGSK